MHTHNKSQEICGINVGVTRDDRYIPVSFSGDVHDNRFLCRRFRFFLRPADW